MAPYAGRAHALRRRLARGRPAAGLSEPALSNREQEVLRLVAQGLTSPGMAARLGLSPRTVESHVAHILAKLDVTTRAAAVAQASKGGLI